MTPEAFAQLVRARRTGRGKWVARCPAHRDHNPSLSIGTGHGGRVLVHCFAGCSLLAILEALGLQVKDLFPGQTTFGVLSTVADRTAWRYREEAKQRMRGRLTDEYRKLSQIVDALGAKLARSPDTNRNGDAMSQLFHNTLERLRAVESQLNEGRKC